MYEIASGSGSIPYGRSASVKPQMLAVGDRHPGADRRALAAVGQAEHPDPVGRRGDRVGRPVRAPVVGDDDLAVDPGLVEERADPVARWPSR